MTGRRRRRRTNRRQRQRMRESSRNLGTNQKVSSSSTSCEKQKWRFFYRVKSVTDGEWPSDEIRVRVTVESGTFQTQDRYFRMSNQQSGKLHFYGRRPCELRFQANPNSKDWIGVGTATASLPADDRKTIIVEIKKRPWIEFEVKEIVGDREDLKEGINLHVTLPGDRKETFTSRKRTTRYAGLEEGKASIDKMTANRCYEVEEIV